MIDYKKLKCPFCGGQVRIAVCDDEGNIHVDGYEEAPWSGLGFLLVHSHEDAPSSKICPIATWDDEGLGVEIYNTKEAAFNTWCSRKRN